MLILFDGDCPVCCAKRDFLQRRDKRGVIRFSDIRTPDFILPVQGIEFQSLEAEIHSVTPDGHVLRGMEVIRTAYHAIGLGWLAAPTGWPVLKPCFDWIYRTVANNRHTISTVLKYSKH